MSEFAPDCAIDSLEGSCIPYRQDRKNEVSELDAQSEEDQKTAARRLCHEAEIATGHRTEGRKEVTVRKRLTSLSTFFPDDLGSGFESKAASD